MSAKPVEHDQLHYPVIDGKPLWRQQLEFEYRTAVSEFLAGNISFHYLVKLGRELGRSEERVRSDVQDSMRLPGNGYVR